MQLRNNTAIVIVAYNNATLIYHMIQRIKQFCTDAYDIVIVDNSTDRGAMSGIKHHAEENGCTYIVTQARSRNGSDSHAFAANVSYLQLKDHYEYFFYLDHDCFPIKLFSVSHILQDKVIAGIGQNKSRVYFWPGCVMFRKDDAIDFSVNNHLQLDTGGNLYKMIDKHGLGACLFFNEKYYENDRFNTESMYNFYTTINDDMFMHFINGSGWNKTDDNEERINSLINILDSRVNGDNIRHRE